MNPITTTEQEVHLRDYINVIRKRKNAVIVFFILTMTAVLIATLAVTPVYEAATQVLIEKSDPNLLSSSAYGSYDPEFSETQVQLIKSFNVATRVVRTLGLDTKYQKYFIKDKGRVGALIAGLKDRLHQLLPDSRYSKGLEIGPEAGDAGKEKSVADEIAAGIIEEIEVKPVRNSRIVNISYMHENPVMAQMVVNALARAYMDEAQEIKMNSVGYTIQWMTEKAGEERVKLERAERNIQQYMKDNNIVTLENRITVLPEKLSEFSSKLTQAIAKRNELAAVVKKIDEIGDKYAEADTVIDMTENPYLQTIYGKQVQAEQIRSELAKKYGAKHPKMIAANEQVVSLEQEKKKEVVRLFKSVHNKYDLANSQVENLTKIVNETKIEAQDLNQKFIKYGMLQRELETNRVLYESLLTQMKEQKLTEQSNKVNIWVVAEAKNPDRPAKPKKARNILLGVVLGLFGGIGMAFFIEYLDNTIASPEEAEKRLGISVLGVLDLLNTKKESVEDILKNDDFSSYAEGVKSIRTAILLSSANNPPKKILVTSMLPSEGKTSTTVNQARSFAKAGYRVVLIDADLRKPRIHKVFGCDNSKGLSVFLAGIQNDGIIQSVTGEANMSVIPAGPIPPNPSELLVSDRFKSLLKTLESQFDFIFIDSAPLFSATETLLLSQVADGTLLVVRAGSTSYDIVREGLKSLRETGSNPLGLIINALNRTKAGYGYGYYGGGYKYAAYYTQEKDLNS